MTCKKQSTRSIILQQREYYLCLTIAEQRLFLMGVFFVCCEEEGDYSWN